MQRFIHQFGQHNLSGLLGDREFIEAYTEALECITHIDSGKFVAHAINFLE